MQTFLPISTFCHICCTFPPLFLTLISATLRKLRSIRLIRAIRAIRTGCIALFGTDLTDSTDILYPPASV